MVGLLVLGGIFYLFYRWGKKDARASNPSDAILVTLRSGKRVGISPEMKAAFLSASRNKAMASQITNDMRSSGFTYADIAEMASAVGIDPAAWSRMVGSA